MACRKKFLVGDIHTGESVEVVEDGRLWRALVFSQTSRTYIEVCYKSRPQCETPVEKLDKMYDYAEEVANFVKDLRSEPFSIV